MTIIVDTREPVLELAELLHEYGASFRVDTLHHKTDFAINMEPGEDPMDPDTETFGIQRKTVNDLISSRDTLKDDLAELRENHTATAILVEGHYVRTGQAISVERGSKVEQTGVSTRWWHNFMLSQQFRGTVRMETDSLRETAQALTFADDWLGTPMTPHVSAIPDAEAFLTHFPNVGPKTQQAILEAYEGSVLDALLDVRDWDDTVDGVGLKTRDGILAWLDGDV